MSNYFSLQLGRMDTKARGANFAGSIRLRGAFLDAENMPNDAALRESELSDMPALEINIRDNGDMGDGCWLTIVNPEKKGEPVLGIELDVGHLRVLRGAIDSVLTMRKASEK